MSPEERKAVAKAWLTLAQVYGKELAQGPLAVMVDSIADLNAGEVLSFMRRWPGVTKFERHPYPKEVRDGVRPPMDTRELATVVARNIDRALSRHGYVWEQGFLGLNGPYWEAFVNGKRERFSSFREAVVAELGPIAWEAIEGRGGWQRMIESQREMEEGQFIAQMRDHVQASYSLAEKGVDASKVSLPSPEKRTGGLVRGGDVRVLEHYRRGDGDEPA